MRIRSAAGAVAVALCIAGCSSGKAGSPATSTTASTSKALTDAQVLRRVSFQAGDLRPGYRPALFQGGDQVTDQVTLDLCGATYPSEQRRRARHQVGAVDAHRRDTGVSIEAVLYDSPAGAQQAMREVRAAKAHCPTGYVRGDVAGVPPLRYRFAAAPDTSWPKVDGVDRFAVTATLNDQRGHSELGSAIYQERGRLLVALYTPDPSSTAKALARSIESFTDVLARRMADLPGSAVEH